jgi:hypothetical protein
MRKLVAVLAAGTAYGFGMGAGVGGGYAQPFEEGFDGQGFAGGKVLLGIIPMLDVEVDFNYYFDGEWLGLYFGPRVKFPAGPLNVFGNGGAGYTLITKEGVDKDLLIFAGGGIEYPFTDMVAVEFNPRFTIVMSDPNFKFMDIGGGVNFYFM